MTDEGAAGQATIMEIQRGVWRFAALRALVAVGAPEQLRDGPLTVAELADRCRAHAPTLSRLLRTIAATGLLRSAGLDKYELTGAGQALLAGRALTSVRFCVDPEVWGALGELTVTVRTGQAPFTLRHGSLYDYLSTKPDVSAVFDELMDTNHGPLAERLAKAATFGETGTVVDVGGGRGTFLASILRAHPGLRGVLLDLERTVPAARDYLAASGVGERCEVVAGDFFTAVPAGADVYLVAHIIHNWDDEQAAVILRAIRAVIPGHGRLLLVEAPLPDDDRPHFGKDLDIRLLTMHEGKERSLEEYSALLTAAGFRPGPVAELGRGECVITASPAPPAPPVSPAEG
jgi:SAM-dependent methyltransferase